MNEKRIISDMDVTWGDFWKAYDKNHSLAATFKLFNIDIARDELDLFESIPSSNKADHQRAIMQLVENLKVRNPEALSASDTESDDDYDEDESVVLLAPGEEELGAVKTSRKSFNLEAECRLKINNGEFNKNPTQILNALKQAQTIEQPEITTRIDEWVDVASKIIGIGGYGQQEIDEDFDKVAEKSVVLKQIIHILQELCGADQQASYNMLVLIYESGYRYDGIANDFAKAFCANRSGINYDELSNWLSKDPAVNYNALQKALTGHSNREEILTELQTRALVTEYQHIREAFAAGKIKEAADSVALLCKVSIQKQFSKDKPMGADDLLPALIELLRRANTTQFDHLLAEKSFERLADKDKAEQSYYLIQLQSAVTALNDPQEGGPLPAADKKLMDKYNKNPVDRVINLFQITRTKQNSLLKIIQAHRQIAKTNIIYITRAIIEEPKLADAVFKRPAGTRLLRRNFRKQLVQNVGLVEQLINSYDPTIITKIKESRLLESSHVKSEAWRKYLQEKLVKAEKFIAIQEELALPSGLSPKEFQEGLEIRAEKFIDDIHNDLRTLDVYLQDEFFIKTLEQNPKLTEKLCEGLDEISQDRVQETLRAYTEGLAAAVDDLQRAHDASMAKSGGIKSSRDACIQFIQDNVKNVPLMELLVNKLRSLHAEDFPDPKQMREFVKDINALLAAKDENGVGLDSRKYHALLNEDKYNKAFAGLFNVNAEDFPEKGFQLPQQTKGNKLAEPEKHIAPKHS